MFLWEGQEKKDVEKFHIRFFSLVFGEHTINSLPLLSQIDLSDGVVIREMPLVKSLPGTERH